MFPRNSPTRELPLHPSDHGHLCYAQWGLSDNNCWVPLVCIPRAESLLVSIWNQVPNVHVRQKRVSIVLGKHSSKINNSDCRLGVYPTQSYEQTFSIYVLTIYLYRYCFYVLPSNSRVELCCTSAIVDTDCILVCSTEVTNRQVLSTLR